MKDHREPEFQELDELTRRIGETSGDTELMNLYNRRGHLSQDLSIGGLVKDHALYEAGARDLGTASEIEKGID